MIDSETQLTIQAPAGGDSDSVPHCARPCRGMLAVAAARAPVYCVLSAAASDTLPDRPMANRAGGQATSRAIRAQPAGGTGASPRGSGATPARHVSRPQALATPTTPHLHPAPPTTRPGPYPPHPPTRRGPAGRAG